MSYSNKNLIKINSVKWYDTDHATRLLVRCHSHNDEYKDYSHLGCGTMLSGTYVSVFWTDSTLPQRQTQ